MKIPYYWGGMILSNSLDDVYKYEYFLKNVLEYRYKKYSKNFALLNGMQAIYDEKKRNGAYKNTFMWYLPIDDPLVSINDEATYWECLLLNHKKLNILKLECYKYARRNGYFPIRSNINGW